MKLRLQPIVTRRTLSRYRGAAVNGVAGAAAHCHSPYSPPLQPSLTSPLVLLHKDGSELGQRVRADIVENPHQPLAVIDR